MEITQSEHQREKKWTEPQGPVGKHQKIYVNQVPGEEENDEARKIFKEIMAEISSNLAKDINWQIQESERSQTGKTQRNPHQDTLQSNFWKLKTNGKMWEQGERETPYL